MFGLLSLISSFQSEKYAFAGKREKGNPAIDMMQIDLATRLTYGSTLTSAKASVLMFYRRLFSLRTTWFRIGWWANMMFMTSYFVAFILHNLTHCLPLTRLWSHQNRCDSALFSGELFGIFNAIIDSTILVLPIYMVLGLKLPRKQKIAVCGVFLLGLM